MGIPSTIGRYEIKGPAGAGGMGLVLEGYEPELGRSVAIKFPKELPGSAGDLLRERFARESRSLSAIRHPNLITLYEVGEHEGQPYAVMEWIEGDTLDAWVRARGPLGESEAAQLVAKIAMAAHYLHLNGYLHRDIKPENVLLRDGEPVLADLGLVKDTSDENSAALTVAGKVIGTPDYAAPEQIRGDLEQMGPRSDVFGLGATLYFLLTSRPPRGSSRSVGQFLSQQIAPPTRWRADLNPELSDLCRRALARSPQRRFRTAQSFADSLIRWALIRDQGRAIYGRGFASLWEDEERHKGYADRLEDEEPKPPGWPNRLGLGVGLFGVLALVASTAIFLNTTPLPAQARVSPSPSGSPDEGFSAVLERQLRTARSDLELAQGDLAATRRANRLLRLKVEAAEETPQRVEVAPEVSAGRRVVYLRTRLRDLREQVRVLELLQAPHQAATKAPAWFLSLPLALRPSLPLPPGVEFGQKRGDYLLRQAGVGLRWIPPEPKRAGPAPEVRIQRGFFLGISEVTRAEYLRFCDETDYPIPRAIQLPGREVASDFPVANVSVEDAEAYVEWARARLPSENEWNYAATGPQRTAWPWGNFADALRLNAGGREDGYPGLARSEAIPAGASPFGIQSTAGNVSEWVADTLAYETSRARTRDGSPVQGAEPGRARYQVALGANYRSEVKSMLSEHRSVHRSGFRSVLVGFRVAVSVGR